VPGGEGSFSVDVRFDGEELHGTYKGQFRGLASSGPVRGSFIRQGYDLPVGNAPPKTELAKRCEAAIDDYFVAVNMDKRSMEARLRARERARRLYELATETTKVLAAPK
jgi:hypothetical protein